VENQTYWERSSKYCYKHYCNFKAAVQ
jgi:hypothetical protein